MYFPVKLKSHSKDEIKKEILQNLDSLDNEELTNLKWYLLMKKNKIDVNIINESNFHEKYNKKGKINNKLLMKEKKEIHVLNYSHKAKKKTKKSETKKKKTIKKLIKEQLEENQNENTKEKSDEILETKDFENKGIDFKNGNFTPILSGRKRGRKPKNIKFTHITSDENKSKDENLNSQKENNNKISPNDENNIENQKTIEIK